MLQRLSVLAANRHAGQSAVLSPFSQAAHKSEHALCNILDAQDVFARPFPVI
jgi:hypothetical protein